MTEQEKETQRRLQAEIDRLNLEIKQALINLSNELTNLALRKAERWNEQLNPKR